jgi:hypothetical protein
VIVHKSTYYFDAASRTPVELLFSNSLEQLLNMQMNQPFADGALPFRPFMINEKKEATPITQSIGVIYQHWPADSVSIRTLMQQWIYRLTGAGSPVPALRLPAGGLWHYFGAHIAGWSVVAQAITTLLSFASRMKKTRRVENNSVYKNTVIKNCALQNSVSQNHFDSGAVHVKHIQLPDGLVHHLLAAARRDGVTVGDIFTAALAEACARYGPNTPTPARPDLALGTIVDLRARTARVPKDVFGLFLGFTTGWYTHRSLYHFPPLLNAAASQRRSALKRRSAEASQLNMLIGFMIARMTGASKMVPFYRKRLPLAGGISNVNLTRAWPGDIHPQVVVRYTRTSPTGPMMPLVITPTTLGNTLTLCCTYRTALLSEKDADNIIESITQRLVRLIR